MSLVRQLNKKGRKRKGAVQNLRRQLLSAPLPHSACPSRTPSHPVTNSARNSGLCFTALPEPTLKPLDQLHFHHQLEKTHGTQQSTNSSRLIHTFHHSAACAISTAQDYHPNVWSNSSSGIGSQVTPALCLNRPCPALSYAATRTPACTEKPQLWPRPCVTAAISMLSNPRHSNSPSTHCRTSPCTRSTQDSSTCAQRNASPCRPGTTTPSSRHKCKRTCAFNDEKRPPYLASIHGQIQPSKYEIWPWKIGI